MYIQSNKKKGKNGTIYESYLLCRKYREDGKIKTEVLLNLSKLPKESIYALKKSLKNDGSQDVAINDIKIINSIDFGYFFVILEVMKKLRIHETIEKTYKDNPNLVKLLIVGKIITRGSKLAIFNWIKRNKAIADLLNINITNLKVDDLYSCLKDIYNIQDKIEKKWNLYHKATHKEIYLYDITSTYLEGEQNELAAFGYNRDKKKGKMQITIGLITDNKGFPLKISVFAGNVPDHKTVKEQLSILKNDFAAEKIILVGDRGMRIKMNLEDLSKEERNGIDYISALTTDEIKNLLHHNIIQLEMFDKDLCEIEKDGIRYILSLNPDLKDKKSDTRNQLRGKFEFELAHIKQSYQNRKNQNQENKRRKENGHKGKLVTEFDNKKLDSYKSRVLKILNKYKMSRFYYIEITQEKFNINFNVEEYQKAKSLDGKYIISTTVNKEKLKTNQVRQEYKGLQKVEHAFRDLKTDKIEIRPLYHRKEEQTRGHVLIAKFSYAIIWYLEQKIYPWLEKYNKINNTKLSFNDIADELNGIKLNEINFGNLFNKSKCTKLNELQKEILAVLNVKLPKEF